MYNMEFSRHIDAPPEIVWEVISDVGRFHDYAPNLSKVEILGGVGQGMRRRCYDQRGVGWNETCSLWDEGRAYTFNVTGSDDGYLFGSLRGTFSVESSNGGALLRVIFEYQYKRELPFITPLLNRLGTPSARRTGEAMLDNWQNEIRRRLENRTAA